MNINNTAKAEIHLIENEIKKVEETLLENIQEIKPILKLDFLTTKELISGSDPLQLKSSQDKLKIELRDLNKILDALWN